MMDDNNVQEDFEVTKQAMKAYEAKLKGELGMVTEEDVEKAKVAWYAADEAASGVYDEAGYAAASWAAYAALKKYIKLRQEFKNGN